MPLFSDEVLASFRPDPRLERQDLSKRCRTRRTRRKRHQPIQGFFPLELIAGKRPERPRPSDGSRAKQNRKR